MAHPVKQIHKNFTNLKKEISLKRKRRTGSISKELLKYKYEEYTNLNMIHIKNEEAMHYKQIFFVLSFKFSFLSIVKKYYSNLCFVFLLSDFSGIFSLHSSLVIFF